MILCVSSKACWKHISSIFFRFIRWLNTRWTFSNMCFIRPNSYTTPTNYYNAKEFKTKTKPASFHLFSYIFIFVYDRLNNIINGDQLTTYSKKKSFQVGAYQVAGIIQTCYSIFVKNMENNIKTKSVPFSTGLGNQGTRESQA